MAALHLSSSHGFAGSHALSAAHVVTSHHEVLSYRWVKEPFGEVGSSGAWTHLKLKPNRTLLGLPRDRHYHPPPPLLRLLTLSLVLGVNILPERKGLCLSAVSAFCPLLIK